MIPQNRQFGYDHPIWLTDNSIPARTMNEYIDKIRLRTLSNIRGNINK